jgi:hypothetical protein
MSEKIPFVDRFGDAFKAATLAEPKAQPARHGLRRFTRGWRLFVVLAVVLVGGGGAVAATKLLSVNSGQYVRSPPAAGYGGEILNIGAHNALAVGMRDTRNIAFAPGYSAWHRGVIRVNLAAPSGQGPVGAAVTSTGALHAWVVGAAACSWAHYWVASTQAGNTRAAAAAARQIERAPALLSEQAVGDVGQSGLEPAIGAIRAGDVKLVRGMIEMGGMVGGSSCNALGPTAVIPPGMSWQQYHARLMTLIQAGRKLILSDPAALKINDQVIHSPQMAAAIGSLLQLVDQPLAKKLAQQAPTGAQPLATRIGEQLLRDHPIHFSLPRNTNPASAAHQTRSGPQGVGGIAVGAELLGIPTHNLPNTLTDLPASNTDVRVALQLAQHVFAVDPLAEVLNLDPASS